MGGDIDAILAMLDDPDGIDFSAAELPPELQLDPDAKKRKAQVERLKALVSQGSYKARRIAVRNLAKAEGLDAVPLLLYAVTDKDERVMREARDALRVLSGRLDGCGLRNGTTPEEKLQAYDKWLQWFWDIRHENDIIAMVLDILVALGCDGDDMSTARSNLFHISNDFFVLASLCRNNDYGHSLVDQCNRSVFHFSSGHPFCVDITNFF